MCLYRHLRRDKLDLQCWALSKNEKIIKVSDLGDENPAFLDDGRNGQPSQKSGHDLCRLCPQRTQVRIRWSLSGGSLCEIEVRWNPRILLIWFSFWCQTHPRSQKMGDRKRNVYCCSMPPSNEVPFGKIKELVSFWSALWNLPNEYFWKTAHQSSSQAGKIQLSHPTEEKEPHWRPGWGWRRKSLQEWTQYHKRLG